MDIGKLVAAIFLVILVVVALYGSVSNVWDSGTGEVGGETGTNNQILECVQANPEMTWQECREDVTGDADG